MSTMKVLLKKPPACKRMLWVFSLGKLRTLSMDRHCTIISEGVLIIEILGQRILYCGGYPVHWSHNISTGIYSVDANSIHITQLWQLKMSPVQFSSVTQSCPTLCDPMNRSTPGLPVHHRFPEFTQTHIHRVSNTIQPSHPLSSPSPPAPNPSQHQSLFQWVNSSHEVAKVLEFQL